MKRPGTKSNPLDTPRTNVPITRTSFIGRQREIAEVAQLLAPSRLVTLSGAGGCGKTRLAQEIAREVRRQFANGVYWVEFGRLADPALVPSAVAKAVNVVEQPGRSLLEALPEYFHDKQLLLVLDNCEHLVSACAQLVESLLQAPEVAILATSREPLDTPGERRYPVVPLSLPPVGAAPAEVTQFEAIQLFAARARAILPGFALTNENTAVIARICRRLDGLPLAIELASARVNVFALEQIETRLADGFAWLASSSRGVEAQHRTLRAAIDWSYTLLSARSSHYPWEIIHCH